VDIGRLDQRRIKVVPVGMFGTFSHVRVCEGGELPRRQAKSIVQHAMRAPPPTAGRAAIGVAESSQAHRLRAGSMIRNASITSGVMRHRHG
jgi:hypothetical protein